MIRKILFFCTLLWLFIPDSYGRKIDSTAYNSSLMHVDDLLMKIETVSTMLDSINKITRNGFDTREIEEDLPDILENLKIINDNLVLYSKVLNVKNLQMYQVLLEDIRNELDTWRSSLFRYNKELAKMKMEMSSFAEDSSARIMATDTVFRHLYYNELNEIKDKYKQARHFTTANLLRITRMQARVSRAYFQTIELEQVVLDKLREFRRRNWGKEFDPLFSMQHNQQLAVSAELIKKAYKGQRKILGYYIYRNWYKQVIIFLSAIAFFLWVFSNYLAIRKAGKRELLAGSKFKYISSFPVLATLVVLFNIAPFFDLNPPSAYVEMMQFFLLIVLTILFTHNWPRRLFYYWLLIIALYVLFAITYGIITPGITIRSCLLLLNILSLIFGILFTWRLKKELAFPSFVKIIFVIYILLNFTSGMANIYGRVSLAKVLSMTGIYGLTQIIGLSVFIRIFTEAFHLQIIRSRTTGGLGSRLNYDRIFKGLNNFLSVIVVVLWSIIFFTNLGIYTPLYRGIETFLTTTRNLGSLTFTLWNVLLFFAILYLSNLAQKYVGNFFGDEDGDFIPDKQGTRLVILRLVLLIVGFLLAITASGLPIDRITIVLGALGVGIGLGLQNIVNNLVSGIILIFESPFQVGDSIEVGNKKGRVKDMGIRSSRLITQDGSEVIVPNGDLLSGQVINWSINNNIVRSEVMIKLEPDAFPVAHDLILKVMNSQPEILKKMQPEIALNAITSSAAEVKIQFWISNIRKERELKSHILMGIYKILKENNIRLL